MLDFMWTLLLSLIENNSQQADLHGKGVVKNQEMQDLLEIVHSLPSINSNKLMKAEFDKMKNGSYFIHGLLSFFQQSMTI